MGGMTAVIYTEVMQSVVLLAGGFALLGITLGAVGGLDSLQMAIPEDRWRLILPATDPDFPWTGLCYAV